MHFTFKKIKNIRSRILRFTLLSFLSFTALVSISQEKKKIEILRAGSLQQNEDISNAQRLIDSVIIRHNEILLYCDSAYTYRGSNRVDAFGNVHINQGDTLHLYAKKIFYDGDTKFSRAIHNVVLKNKATTLHTDTLDYDMERSIGYYNCGGTIIDSTNTLSSQIAKYYLNENRIHFSDSVKGYNENYTLISDSIKYNTTTEVIYIDGATTINDSLNTLYSEDGWYNTTTGETQLTLNPKIYNETQFIKGDYISFNQINGNGMATGTVHMEDYEKRTIVKGNAVTFNKITEIASATDSAVFMVYNNVDTLFLHADTLRTLPDTIEGANLVKAYYGVRFFRNDIQGICDSLIYFSKDSLVQLHNNPVIWSEIHQLSANYIELVQHTNSPDEMHLSQNSFIISKLDSGRFDQIKGKDMLGYVVDGKLNDVNVDGNGQTLYYARDKEALIGLNHAESSNISIRFKEARIHKIAFLKQPEGNLKPLLDLTEADKTLAGFEWKNHLRPFSKDDIFRVPKKTNIQPDDKPTTENQTKEIN